MLEGRIKKWYIFAFFISFSLIFARLIQLQILKGGEYSRLQKKYYLKLILEPGLRGKILDTKGEVLVDTQLKFAISSYNQLSSKKIKELSTLLPNLELKKKRSPSLLLEEISDSCSFSTIAKLAERIEDYPYLILHTKVSRIYPKGNLAAHILGHLAPPSKEDLERGDYLPYEEKGVMGIEAVGEPYLKGKRGGKLILINNKGELLKELVRKIPGKGDDIKLTINSEIQALLEDLLKDKTGAIVIVDVNKGTVLAAASSPNFYPAHFLSSYKLKKEEADKLFSSPKKPLFNRYLQGLYAPGSIFKLVIAAAALQEGIISPEDKLHCSGKLKIGDRIFHCFHKIPHGDINIEEAIANSCNIFFFKLALKLGVEKILEYAKKFGFAEKTEIELPFEKSSVVYSPGWKERFLKEPWHLGETLNLAIGQGYINTTLLQLARFMACLATKGKLFNLRIIEKIGEKEINYSTFRNIRLRDDVWETLYRGMNKVVKEGTGKAAAVPYLNIYGKTGTSQNPGEDHSWFCCFAGRKSPKIALVIIIEHGGPGGKTAASLARKILSSLEL